MKKSKKLCEGCYNDFYNQGGGGAKECWSYANAEVCKRAFIHVSMVPPWKVRPVTTLTCHHKRNYWAVKPEDRQLTADEKHKQEYDGGDYR